MFTWGFWLIKLLNNKRKMGDSRNAGEESKGDRAMKDFASNSGHTREFRLDLEADEPQKGTRQQTGVNRLVSYKVIWILKASFSLCKYTRKDEIFVIHILL